MLSSLKNAHTRCSALIKLTFTKLNSYKIHIHYAQLSYNSHLQNSALIKFTFAMLSSPKIHICNAQLS